MYSSLGSALSSYLGNTIHRGLPGSRARAMLSSDGLTCAMSPLRVSRHTGPMQASGAKPRINSIESFLRLIGRATGMRSRFEGTISASSSESRRQPRLASAAVNVLLPDPGGAGKHHRTAAALYDCCMEHQETVAVIGDAPVEPPFEHRVGLVQGQRLEGTSTVEQEIDLRAEPATDDGPGGQFHMKIAKPGLVDRIRGIQELQRARDARERGTYARDERSNVDRYATTREPRSE